MIVVVRSLADTYKEENKKLKLKCELYETYIDSLEKQRAELEREHIKNKQKKNGGKKDE